MKRCVGLAPRHIMQFTVIQYCTHIYILEQHCSIILSTNLSCYIILCWGFCFTVHVRIKSSQHIYKCCNSVVRPNLFHTVIIVRCAIRDHLQKLSRVPLNRSYGSEILILPSFTPFVMKQ